MPKFCKKNLSSWISHTYRILPVITFPLTATLLLGCSNSPIVSECDSCGPTPPAKTIATTLTVIGPTEPQIQGREVQFQIKINPAPEMGFETVRIDDVTESLFNYALPGTLGSATLQKGTATFSTTPTRAGIRTYTATYGGDGLYESSSGSLRMAINVPPTSNSCGLGSSMYLLSSGSAAPNQTTYASTAVDQSAVCAQNSGTILTLNSPLITKSGSGGTPYGGDPSGINAGVLAYGSSGTTDSGATIYLQGTPSVTASSANYAAFASGFGSTLDISNATITSTHSGATLGVGNNGKIEIANSKVTSDGSLMTVLDGGSVILRDTSLISNSFETINFHGLNDSSNMTAEFRMTGGSISSDTPVFSFWGKQTTNIYLSQVDFSKINTQPQTSLNYLPNENNVSLYLTLDNQKLRGTIHGTPSSTLILKNGSSLDGNLNGGGSVTLDASSSWTIYTGTDVLVFADPGGISGSNVLNIIGNGKTIYYSKALNPSLEGRTYALKNGGYLIPH